MDKQGTEITFSSVIIFLYTLSLHFSLHFHFISVYTFISFQFSLSCTVFSLALQFKNTSNEGILSQLIITLAYFHTPQISLFTTPAHP